MPTMRRFTSFDTENLYPDFFRTAIVFITILSRFMRRCASRFLFICLTVIWIKNAFAPLILSCV